MSGEKKTMRGEQKGDGKENEASSGYELVKIKENKGKGTQTDQEETSSGNKTQTKSLGNELGGGGRGGNQQATGAQK